MQTPDQRCVIACLGSSSTAAKGSYDWIGDLQSRPENAALRFLNFGIGGDLAFNGLVRLPAVMQHRPDRLLVLIGGNDALTAASPRFRQFLRWWKKIPQAPSATWYETNLRQIVREARQHSQVDVSLCSLVPIGECPNAQHPFQKKINELIREYSGIVKRVADDTGVDYIPIYERICEQICQQPGREMTEIRVLPLYRDAICHRLFGWSFDDLATRNGWQFHIDGIHLNSRGGKILANAVQDHLNEKKRIQ